MKTYWQEDHNWGDILPPYLVKTIGGVTPVRARRQDGGKLLSVGSVLHHLRANDIVWGAGFISSTPTYRRPAATICAVRGPLTRQLLTDRGKHVPAVYGDPAILIPHLISCAPREKYAVGVIPHYAEYESTPLWEDDCDEITAINILDGLREVIEQVRDCAAIVSSSLHGVILAESYGIPAVWASFDRGKVLGGPFKFWDYYSATNRFPFPVDFSSVTPRPRDLITAVAKWPWLPVEHKTRGLALGLLHSCPFNEEYSSLDDLPRELLR